MVFSGNKFFISSTKEQLDAHELYIFEIGTSESSGAQDLLDVIKTKRTLVEKRENEINKISSEHAGLQSRLDARAGKTTSTPESYLLKQRVTWREKVLLAERPTLQYVLLHKGLIEELRLKHNLTSPATTTIDLGERVFKQQMLLAQALAEDIEVLKRQISQLNLDRIFEPTCELEDTLLRLQSQQEAEMKELALLQSLFTQERWEKVKQVYARFPDKRSMGCMNALYRGLGGMFSWQEAKALRRTVYKESVEYEKRFPPRLRARRKKEGINTNNVYRMMETLRRQDRAGAHAITYYDKNSKRYDPSLRAVILSMVSAKQPGWFFFGVGLHGGYHTVGIALEVSISGNISIYWLDQFSWNGFAEKNNVSTETAMNKQVYKELFRPKDYGYNHIRVWPILPADPLPELDLSGWSVDESYTGHPYDYNIDFP